MVFYFYSAAVMFLVPYKKRVVDSSGHLWRKRQVTPGDHLEGIGGKKTFIHTGWAEEECVRIKTVQGAGKWLRRAGSKHTTSPKQLSGLGGHCTELSSNLKKIHCWAAKKPRRKDALQENKIVRGLSVANHLKILFLLYLMT